MSRSYKKHPVGGDKPDKAFKRIANHTVRHKLKDENAELQNGAFKKVFESWNIRDYKDRCTFEEYYRSIMALRKRLLHAKLCSEEWLDEHFPADKKEQYKRWSKWYKRK